MSYGASSYIKLLKISKFMSKFQRLPKIQAGITSNKFLIARLFLKFSFTCTPLGVLLFCGRLVELTYNRACKCLIKSVPITHQFPLYMGRRSFFVLFFDPKIEYVDFFSVTWMFKRLSLF